MQGKVLLDQLNLLRRPRGKVDRDTRVLEHLFYVKVRELEGEVNLSAHAKLAKSSGEREIS